MKHSPSLKELSSILPKGATPVPEAFHSTGDSVVTIHDTGGQDPKLTEVKHTNFALLSLAALGVVFGDVGTSPLYTISSMFAHNATPSTDDLLGGLSLVLWILFLVVTVKYSIFVLSADNHGEGGTFALGGLLTHADNVSIRFKRFVLVLAVIGAALLIGDGMLTPAITVLSAIQGIATYAPTLQPAVVPISAVLIVVLYMVQRFGTHKIGVSFGPIMLLWFASIAAIGIYNLALYDPAVFRAFNPQLAIQYFLRNGTDGFLQLGNVMLAVTGVEALYADLGHFTKGSIRLAWLAVVYPSVMFSYMGQVAFCEAYPQQVSQSFFASVPYSVFYPMLVLASLSTLIASQSVISGAFSLVHQAISLQVCPRLSVYFTNEGKSGQIYVPAVNWTLMVFTVGLVIGFQTADNLSAAYGLAVSMIMFFTTCLLALVMHKVWRWHPVAWIPFLAFFGFIDALLVAANVEKVPSGAWFALVIAFFLSVIFIVWMYGHECLHEKLSHEGFDLHQLEETLEHEHIVRTPGIGVFLSGTEDVTKVPQSLTEYLSRTESLPATAIFCTARVTIERPSLEGIRDRAVFTCISRPLGLYRVVVNYGFAEDLTSLPQMLLRHQPDDESFGDKRVVFHSSQDVVVPDPQSNWFHRLVISLYSAEYVLSTPVHNRFGLQPQSSMELACKVAL